MTQLEFDFRQKVLPADGNDYHLLPASEKERRFAQTIAARRKIAVPDTVLGDRRKLASWIDRHKSDLDSKFARYPSSRQVAFAERIGRIKRRAVPAECFKDRTLMSRWIDHNK